MKKAIPHIAAVVIFLIITLVYLKPVMSGKALVGHDTEGWIGMSEETVNWNDSHDEGTLWTNSMFGGMPTYQIAMKGHDNVLSWVMGHTLYQLPLVVYVMLLYFVGFYIMCQCLKLNPWLSIAVSIGFAFCSYNVIILAVGHNTKALAIAYMPTVVGSIIYAFRQNRYIGAILTAIFLCLMINANHVQIIYYTLIVVLVYGLSELIYAIKGRTTKELLKTSGLLMCSALVAVGMNWTLLKTTEEYSEETMRGHSNGLTIDKTSQSNGLDKDYITGWSYGIGETMTLLIPNARGGASAEILAEGSHVENLYKKYGSSNATEILKSQPMPTYWGEQPFTAGPVYAGAVICMLALLGLLMTEGKNRWWLLGALTVTLFLSWGRHFSIWTDFWIDYVPKYNMFRTVSMALVGSCLVLAILAALGLKAWFQPKEGTRQIEIRWRKTALAISVGVTGFICLLLWLFPGIAGNFVSTSDNAMISNGYPAELIDALREDRADMLASSARRSLIFIMLSGVVLMLSQKSGNTDKSKTIIGASLIGILVLVDMVPVAKKYLNDDMFSKKRDRKEYFSPSIADSFILEDRSQNRVLDLTTDVFNSSRPSYFHHSIGGYHAAKLRRYQELINVHLNREIGNIISTFQVAGQAKPEEVNQMFATTFAQSPVLNMLNMKYVIYNPEQPPLLNPMANGNAWFVSQVVLAKNADEEMLALGHMDTKNTLVADKENKVGIPQKFINEKGKLALTENNVNDRIEMEAYAPNHLTYISETSNERLAVFSEIYYPKGWTATIDGKETEYFRANYLLRAMVVPKGKHKIEFKFNPESFATGNKIQTAASVLLILALCGYAFYVVSSARKKV